MRIYYPWHGPEHCAKKLGRKPNAVRCKAHSMMLTVGDPKGYVAISSLNGGRNNDDYRWLVNRAREDGVIRTCGAQELLVVPEEWADKILDDLSARKHNRKVHSEWLTLHEFADMLGVNHETLRKAMIGSPGKAPRLQRYVQDVEHVKPDAHNLHWRFHPAEAKLAALRYTPFDPVSVLPWNQEDAA